MSLTREIWRERWLDCINELTSIELQKSSWLDRHQRNPHWSFIEFMCTYFDDLLCDFPYSHYIEIKWVSAQEYEILKSWHTALDIYKSPDNDDHDREGILNDAKWITIVKMGTEAKNKLAELLPINEKEILEAYIDYRLFT